MVTQDVMAKVFNMALNGPGMSDEVKLDLKASRKQLLVLHQLIEKGLSGKKEDKTPSLLSSIPEGMLQELKELANKLLEKGNLVETVESLNSFNE